MGTEEYKLLFQVVQSVITAAVWVYVYLTNKDKVTNNRISNMEDGFNGKIANHSDRLAKVETRLEQLPTHRDMAQIHDKINQVSDCVSNLEGEFTGVKHTLGVIHDFLLRGKRP